MMDAFDVWEGKGTVQFFYFMAEGEGSLVRQSKLRYAFLFLRKYFLYGSRYLSFHGNNEINLLTNL